MNELIYPIGKEEMISDPSSVEVKNWMDEIAALPKKLRKAVTDLTDQQLNTPYRDNGWTIRQVVHHIADSHLNGYSRVKRTLTEDKPMILSYRQDAWSKLADYELPVTSSLELITALHRRWTRLLRSLTPDQLDRELVHPKFSTITLKQLIGHYAWHGNHHLAQITNLTTRKNWSS